MTLTSEQRAAIDNQRTQRSNTMRPCTGQNTESTEKDTRHGRLRNGH